VISRDQPKWLAAAVGALGFPVLPLAWQIFGEHRRKRAIASAKTPPKSTLSAGDRYVMRAFVVTLAVLGPMFVAGRFGVLRGAWNNKTWFLPEDLGSYSEASGNASKTGLLSLVPADAEVVVVVHEPEKDGKKAKTGVFAYGDHQLLIAAPNDKVEAENFDDKLKELNDQREKIPFIKIDPVVKVSSDSNGFVLAGERWKSKVSASGPGPSAALRRELDRAPDNAVVAAAFVPKGSLATLGIRAAAGWLLMSEEKMVVDARVEVVDPAAADKVLAEARSAWNTKGSELPAKCRDEVDQIADRIQIERNGAIVTFHVEVPTDKLLGLMFCGLGK